MGRYRISHTSTPEEFKSYCVDYRNEAKEKLNDFIANHKTDSEFRKWANTKIDIDYYIALLQFRLVYKQQDDSSAATSKDYYDFINSLEMKFNKSVICTNYFRLIETYYNYYLKPGRHKLIQQLAIILISCIYFGFFVYFASNVTLINDT